jgi:hypothetical protein
MKLTSCAALAAPLLFARSGIALAQAGEGGTGVGGSTAFNPAVSVILDGHYVSYSADPYPYELPGFALPEEAGPLPEGFSLDETELAASANIDDKFYGFMTASLALDAGETAIELEEAYMETLALPYGLTAKAGRFLSDIGYLNPIHAHAWDFADAPLAYEAMLGGSFGDTGLQLRWIAPAPILVELGAEAFRGESFPAAGAAASRGQGASSVFVHFGADVGVGNSFRAGLSRLSADANERTSVFGERSASFGGTSDLTIVDFVWKWAKNGNPRDRYFVIQGEYLHRKERGALTLADVAEAGPYSGTQSGYYLQGVYQFRPPRWRAGLRYDRLEASNDLAGAAAELPLAADGHPSRISAMVDFSNSEFSRLRLQVDRNRFGPETDTQFIVQYLMSMGAHGAHRF